MTTPGFEKHEESQKFWVCGGVNDSAPTAGFQHGQRWGPSLRAGLKKAFEGVGLAGWLTLSKACPRAGFSLAEMRVTRVQLGRRSSVNLIPQHFRQGAGTTSPRSCNSSALFWSEAMAPIGVGSPWLWLRITANQIELVCGCPFNADLRGDSKTSVLNWINILSLDAPVVALLWQGFFVQLFRVEISLAARCVLGLSVWLAYLADRWLDGRLLPPGGAITLRHRFAQRHGRAIAIAWVLVFVGDFMLALVGLSQREFMFGLVLGFGVLGYLAFVHLRSLHRIIGRTKEFLVAVMFSAGSGVFVLANTAENPGELVFCLAVFFSLCLVNCVLVSSWERAEDAEQAQPSMAICWNLSPALTRRIALGMLAGAAVVSFFWWEQPVGWTSLATAISLLLLAILERVAARLTLNQRHVLADATLLSPVGIMFLN